MVELGCAGLTADDGPMIDEIRPLEELVCAAQARQSRLAAAFAGRLVDWSAEEAPA